MKVLVTGGTSLIGGAVAAGLARAGHEVATLQRSEGPPGHQSFRGDITDPVLVSRAVAGRDAVVHLAARVGVVGSWGQFEQTNVEGTRTVVGAVQRARVPRLIHVSSPSVAHSGASLVGAPAGAADPDAARGHYSRSKAMAEIVALAATSPDLAVTAIRPHLVWGPGDTQLVGRIVERARQGRLALVGSGMALIDTTYVDNAADAIVAAVERTPAVTGRALVVSNGQPRMVRELLRRIVLAAGLDPPSWGVPFAVARTGGAVAERIWERRGRLDDPPMTSFLAEQLATAHWFDQRDTRRLLGWEPIVPLDEGFRRLAVWFQSTGV